MGNHGVCGSLIRLRRLADERSQRVDRFLHRPGLGIELLSRSRTLLRVGGVALRDLVHLRHREADLLDALRLLLGGRGDLGDERVGRRHLGDDLIERLAHLAAARRAAAAIGDRGLNLLGGLLGRGGTPLGERPNFVGHNGEPGTRLSGPSRLDGGVEGEDVGLECDLVDVLDDLRDLGTGSLDGVHGRVHLGHRLGSRLCCRAGLVGEILGLLGILRRAADHDRHLLECGTRLGNARRLLAAA